MDIDERIEVAYEEKDFELIAALYETEIVKKSLSIDQYSLFSVLHALNEQGSYDEVVRITNKFFYDIWHRQKSEWFMKQVAIWHLIAVISTDNKKEMPASLFFFKNFYPSVDETDALQELLHVFEGVAKKQYYSFIKPFYTFFICFEIIELVFDFFSIYTATVFLVLGIVEVINMINRKNASYNFSFIVFQGLLFVKSLYRWMYWTLSKPAIKIKAYTET